MFLTVACVVFAFGAGMILQKARDQRQKVRDDAELYERLTTHFATEMEKQKGIAPLPSVESPPKFRLIQGGRAS